jgi:hypothetical protein
MESGMGWPVQIILPKERVQGLNWRRWIFSFLAILFISLMSGIIMNFANPVEGVNYLKLFFLLFLVAVFIFFIFLSVRVYYFGLCLSAFEAYEKESALTKKDWTEWASRELYVSAYKLFTPLDISQSKLVSGKSVEVYSEQQLKLRGHSGEAYNEEQIIYELLASVRAKVMELAIICSFDVMFTYGSSNVSFSTFKECWVSIGLPERCLNNYSNLHGTIQQEFDRLTSAKNNLVTIILSANIEGVEGCFAELTEFASILLVTHQRELSGEKNNGVALRELVCGKALAKQELIHMMTYQPDVLETSKVFFSNMNVDEVLDISDLLRTSYLSMDISWEYEMQDMNLLLGRLGDKHFWLVFTLALYVAEKSGEAVLMISSVGNDYIFNVVKPFENSREQ